MYRKWHFLYTCNWSPIEDVVFYSFPVEPRGFEAKTIVVRPYYVGFSNHRQRRAISSTTPSRITEAAIHSKGETTSSASQTPSRSAITGLTKV